MKYNWINGIVYTLLERIGEFQIFFSEAAQYIAAICLLLSIGMMCVKIFLQAADARQEFIKLFLNITIYTVMVWLFPIAMKGLIGFATSMGYGAVMYGGRYTSNGYNGTEQGMVGHSDGEFYEWIAKECGDIFSLDDNKMSESDAGGKNFVKTQFNMNIIDKKSGYIDLNKSFKFVLAYMKLRFDAAPKVSLLHAGTSLLFFLTYCIGVILAFAVYIIIMINYVMALFDYFALQGFGILFVPLFLWEGTKQNTSTLIQSITKILVKLIVISAIMFLCFMTIIDNLKDLYYTSLTPNLLDGIGAQLTGCLTLIFQSVFLFLLSKETTAIADFLCGGTPRLSFGEFARAAAGTAAATAGGFMAGKSADNTFGNMKEGAKNALASGAKGFITGGIAGGVAAMAKQGAMNLGKGAVSAMKGAGNALVKGADTMMKATGAYGAASQEGISIPGMYGGRGLLPSGVGSDSNDSGNGKGGSHENNVSDGSKATANSATGTSNSSSNSSSDVSSGANDNKAISSGGKDSGENKDSNNPSTQNSTNSTSDNGNNSLSTSSGGNNSESNDVKTNSSTSSSKGSEQAKTNQVLRQEGLKGIYGNVDGNKESFGNNMLKSANKNAESSNYHTRQLGRIQAAVGGFANAYSKSRESNGVLKSLGNAIVDTAKNSDVATSLKSMNEGLKSFKDSKDKGMSFSDSMKNAVDSSMNTPSNSMVRAINFGGGITQTDSMGNTVNLRALGKESVNYDDRGNKDDNGNNKSTFEATLKYGKGERALEDADKNQKGDNN